MKKFVIVVLFLFVYSTSHSKDFTVETGPTIGDQPANLLLLTYEDNHYEIYKWLQPKLHVGLIQREQDNYYMAGADVLIGYRLLEPSVLLNIGLSRFLDKPERLGTKLNFHLTVEVRWDIMDYRFFGKFAHWSNGGGSILPPGQDRNIGEDFLLIGFLF